MTALSSALAGLPDPSEDQIIAGNGIAKWIAPLFDDPQLNHLAGIDTGYTMILNRPCPLTPAILKLGGFAGTGKTTLIAHLAKQWIAAGLTVAFATYTGKAASVLERALTRAGVAPAYVGTIHGLIYQPDIDENGAMRGWVRADELDYDLLVIDEASMVPTSIVADLKTFGVPILAVGDHGQLPPVGEDAGLMAEPDLRLERIHRQATGNPIIAIATAVREGRPMSQIIAAINAFDDPRVRHMSGREGLGAALNMTADPSRSFFITYTNAARVSMNAAMRRARGIDPASRVQKDESVICLRNNYDFDGLIANGMRGIVTSDVTGDLKGWYTGTVAFENGKTVDKAPMLATQFMRPTFARYDEITEAGGPKIRSWDMAKLLCDFGYAITCHKSQGSQAERVAVYLEGSLGRMTDDERRRWIYTACTRAVGELLLVTP